MVKQLLGCGPTVYKNFPRQPFSKKVPINYVNHSVHLAFYQSTTQYYSDLLPITFFVLIFHHYCMRHCPYYSLFTPGVSIVSIDCVRKLVVGVNSPHHISVNTPSIYTYT